MDANTREAAGARVAALLGDAAVLVFDEARQPACRA